MNLRSNRLFSQALPAIIIVGALWVTVAFRPTNSGIDVRVVPADALRGERISVSKPGRRETLGTKRVGADGRVRFDLDPGRYVVRASARAGARPRTVFVREFRYVPVRIVAGEDRPS